MIKVDKENYGRFILKAQLALECYNDLTNMHSNLCEEVFNLISLYRKSSYDDSLKEKVVNKIIEAIEEIGIDNFKIYDDGDVEYVSKK